MIIDKKYRIPLVGKYNRGVYVCPNCRLKLAFNEKHGTMYDHIIGFSSAYIGEVVILECPECFTKWYFHSGINTSLDHYEYFLDMIENGTQKHFKK